MASMVTLKNGAQVEESYQKLTSFNIHQVKQQFFCKI